MEIKVYLRILRKRWLLFFGGLIVTVGATVWFVSLQEPQFESTGTFVVRPRPVVAENTVRAIDALTRGVQINSTFASIASSDLIRRQARQRVDPAISTSGFRTSGRVITGTNIIELSVSGPNAEGAHALAVALGEETIAYIDELDETFELTPLDPPSLPRNPERSAAMLTIALGVVAGTVLGSLLAFSAEMIGGAPPVIIRRSSEPDLATVPDDHASYARSGGSDLSGEVAVTPADRVGVEARVRTGPSIDVRAIQRDFWYVTGAHTAALDDAGIETVADLATSDVSELVEIFDEMRLSGVGRARAAELIAWSRAMVEADTREPVSVATFEVVSSDPDPEATDVGVLCAHLRQVALSTMPQFPKDWSVMTRGGAAMFVVVAPRIEGGDRQSLATYLDGWKVALENAAVDLPTNGADANGCAAHVPTVTISIGEGTSAGLVDYLDVERFS